MRKTLSRLIALFALTCAPALMPLLHAQYQMQVFGAWHCSSDYCSWATAPNMTTFATDNNWMIAGDSGKPAVNLVVLSFVDPLKLLDGTNDSGDTNGVPNGMTSAVVSYFENAGVRVMLSIGGQTYTSDWNTALATNPTQLGLDAANLAKSLNVGIEIDYEQSSSPDTTDLQTFVNAYRSVEPYDATGSNPAARLTIDLGAGDQYLSALAAWATQYELQDSNPVLDYANAMVVKASTSVSAYEKDWAEHIDGYPTLGVPPLAPARLTGSFFLMNGSAHPNCSNYSNSQQEQAYPWVSTVAPGGAGTTNGMLGLMFWAAGCPGTHSTCSFPPNTCEGGMGVAAGTFGIPIPMPALRQQ